MDNGANASGVTAMHVYAHEDVRMKRREFLGVVASVLAFSRAAQGKIRRVGYLSAGPPVTDDSPDIRSGHRGAQAPRLDRGQHHSVRTARGGGRDRSIADAGE